MKLVYRVPPGWTREASRLVRSDWEAAKEGSIPTVAGGAEGEEFVARFKRDREGIPGLEIVDAPCDDGTPRCYARWASSDARLRAWADVGAPVLAPAEDGRPSLAEWVAACEGSALGRSQAWWDETVELATTAILGFQWGPFPALASGNALGFICAIIPQGTVMINGWQDPSPRTVATPAELRALLDILARPA